MTIHTIAPGGVALFIGERDLRERGLSLASLDLENARAIAEEAFAKAGITVDRGLEIEAFAGEDGALVFARLVYAAPEFYAFSEYETLLEGLRALGEPGVFVKLTYVGGNYILTVVGEQTEAETLSEFGVKLKAEPGYSAFLREHGREISDGAETWELYTRLTNKN